MALRNGVGGCLLGRGPPCRRGAILYHMGREKVGCCWLSAITLHAVIMPPLAAASNLNNSLGSILGSGGRTQVKKTPPSTNDEARGRKCLLVWLVCRTGGWGAGGVPARL